MNSKRELNSKPNVWLSVTTATWLNASGPSRDHLENVGRELLLSALSPLHLS